MGLPKFIWPHYSPDDVQNGRSGDSEEIYEELARHSVSDRIRLLYFPLVAIRSRVNSYRSKD